MSRYIDADYEIGAIKIAREKGYKFNYDTLIDFVNILPTEDVTPSKYIDWIYVNGNEYGVYKCSKCGKYQTYKSNFCEDCGGEYIERNKDEKEEI